MPQNLHILQVEQEVPGDDMCILDHVLGTDTERTALLLEKDEIIALDISKIDEVKKMEVEERMREIDEQLDLIDASAAPSKATQILVGLGFRVDQL